MAKVCKPKGDELQKGFCKPDEETAQQNLTDPNYRSINIQECERQSQQRRSVRIRNILQQQNQKPYFY